MINLLSSETKAQLQAARRNVVLRRLLFFVSSIVLAIGAIYAYGFFTAEKEYALASENNSIALSHLKQYEKVKHEAAQYRSDLQIAKTILGSEFMFSEFLIDAAGILPPNTILDNLTMTTKQTVSATVKPGTLQLKARSKGYDDALKLKDALEASELFSDVKLLNIKRPEKTEGLKGIQATYPYEITLEVVVTTLGGV